MTLGERRRAAWSSILMDSHPLQPCWVPQNPSVIPLPWLHVQTIIVSLQPSEGCF